MDLNGHILRKALANNICGPWAKRIELAEDKHALMQMYVDGIDFCLKNEFPSNGDLISLAGDIINQYGVYVAQGINLHNQSFAALLGACSAEIRYSDYSVSNLYIKHTSQVNIITTDNAVVMIDVFDKTTLNVEAYGNSRVMVNIYGTAKVNHTQSGNAIIKIVHKNKSTY